VRANYRGEPALEAPLKLTALLLAPAILLGAAVATPAAAEDSKPIPITLTNEGLVPSTIDVKSGQPVKLVVTRKAERTCATEVVMKDFGVNEPLPLDKPVTVTVTPKKPGKYKVTCGMGMVLGVINVQ
jgi:plastocyanin domain-containing protein